MTGKSQPLIRASEPAAALPIARLRKSCRLVKSLPMFAPYGVFKPSLEIAELQRICLDKTGFMSSNSQVCAKSRIPSTLSISRVRKLAVALRIVPPQQNHIVLCQ